MLWERKDVGRWSLTCDGCLATLPHVIGTRDDAVAALTAGPHYWVEWPGQQIRCLPCQLKAWSVSEYNARGQRITRRRRR